MIHTLGKWAHSEAVNNAKQGEKMLLSKIRLPPADFLIDAAIAHFGETGKSVRGFIVPPEMWEELKLDPDTKKTQFSFVLDVEGFDVVASKFQPPTLLEDGPNGRGVEL